MLMEAMERIVGSEIRLRGNRVPKERGLGVAKLYNNENGSITITYLL